MRDDVVRGFICGTAWSCELGFDANGTVIYGSLDDLKATHKAEGHLAECGVAEVEIRIVGWPIEGKPQNKHRLREVE